MTLAQRLMRAAEWEERLENLVFQGEELEAADAERLELSRVRFENCRFSGCNFMKAYLWDVEFLNCDISNCDFGYSYWKNCFLRSSKAQGTDFFKTLLAGVDLSTCELSQLILSDDLRELRGAKIDALQAPEFVRLLGMVIV